MIRGEHKFLYRRTKYFLYFTDFSHVLLDKKITVMIFEIRTIQTYLIIVWEESAFPNRNWSGTPYQYMFSRQINFAVNIILLDTFLASFMIELAQLLKLWPFGEWGTYKMTQSTTLVIAVKYAQSHMHLKLRKDHRFVRVSYITIK